MMSWQKELDRILYIRVPGPGKPVFCKAIQEQRRKR